jgi:hypothetical protein
VRDISDLQRMRLMQRPLAATSSGARPLARLSRALDDSYALELDESAVWIDGAPIRGSDVEAGLAAGVRSLAAYASLVGLRCEPDCRVRSEKIHVRAECGLRSLLSLLSRPAFRPRRVSSRGPEGTGPYVPDRASGGLLDPATGSTVVFHVEAAAARALALFDAGELDATAPSCFEIAKLAAGQDCFVPFASDLHAMLLFNPTRAERLSSYAGRCALAVRLSGWLSGWDGRGQLIAPNPVLRDLPAAPIDADPTDLELVFADYWPNRALMRKVAAALRELGWPAPRLRPMSLSGLLEATSSARFDVALVIVQGTFGRALSPWATAAAAAARIPGCTSRVLETFRAVCRGEANLAALVENVLPSVPLLPLCHFDSGYLTRDRSRWRCVDDEPVLSRG